MDLSSRVVKKIALRVECESSVWVCNRSITILTPQKKRRRRERTKRWPVSTRSRAHELLPPQTNNFDDTEESESSSRSCDGVMLEEKSLIMCYMIHACTQSKFSRLCKGKPTNRCHQAWPHQHLALHKRDSLLGFRLELCLCICWLAM